MNRSNAQSTVDDELATPRRSVAEPFFDRAERLKAALGDTVDEQLRSARRIARRTQHAAEDLADGVRLQTRRQPLRTLGMALGVGTILGFVIGWRRTARHHEH